MTRLVPVQVDGFTITPEGNGDIISVNLSGSCDSKSLPVLARFLDDLHGEAVRAGVKSVVLGCENLYFMNSASVKCFVVWLTKVRALPPLQAYRVRARTNSSLAWQGRTFGSIQRSAPDVLSISP
jgi:hypothetical protein